MEVVTEFVEMLMYIIVIGLTDALQRTSIELFQHTGVYHTGAVMRYRTEANILGCMRHCSLDLACVSFNYNKQSHQCQLMGNILQAGELEADANMDFYGK